MAAQRRNGNDLQATLEAVSNPRRREILELLRGKPRRASEIAREFDCSWPAISRHMKLLRRAGLIGLEHGGDGGARRYVLEREPLAAVKSWMERFTR